MYHQAILKNPYAILYISCQTECMCKLAMSMYPPIFEYTQIQTYTTCSIALDANVYNLKYIKYSDIKNDLTNDGAELDSKNMAEQLVIKAIEINGFAIVYVDQSYFGKKFYCYVLYLSLLGVNTFMDMYSTNITDPDNRVSMLRKYIALTDDDIMSAYSHTRLVKSIQ